jgi:hypothetical protein
MMRFRIQVYFVILNRKKEEWDEQVYVNDIFSYFSSNDFASLPGIGSQHHGNKSCDRKRLSAERVPLPWAVTPTPKVDPMSRPIFTKFKLPKFS